MFVPRHTYIYLGDGCFKSSCVPTNTLVVFWHFPAPETLSDDLPRSLSLQHPLLKKEVVYFHLSLVPLPGIPDHCTGLICTCLIQGRKQVAGWQGKTIFTVAVRQKKNGIFLKEISPIIFLTEFS